MKKITIKNPNGIGSIEPRGKKGIYVARWMIDGKTFKKSTGTADKTEALRLLQEWTAPFLLKTDVETVQALAAQARVKANLSKSVPLDDIFESWKLRHKGTAWTAGTETIYSKIVNRFVVWMKANHPKVKEIAGVTPEIAAEYVNQKLKPGHAVRYYNNEIHALLLAWNVLQGTGDGILNPWEGKETKGDDSIEKQPFSESEMKTMIEKAPTEEWRTLILLGRYTGQRMGDLCHFKWDVINFDDDVFNPFMQEKTKRIIRDLPIAPELRAQLEKTPVEKRTGYILPNMAKRYDKRPANISVAFSHFLRRHGIEGREALRPGAIQRRSLKSFHSLRHTFISRGIAAGLTFEQVAFISGHGSRKNIQRYSHASADTLRAVISAQSMTGAEAKTAGKIQMLERMVSGWSPEDIKAAIKALQKKIA